MITLLLNGCIVRQCDCCELWVVWCGDCHRQIGDPTARDTAEFMADAHEGLHAECAAL